MVTLTSREHTITVVCWMCDASHTLMVNITDVADWKLGEMIQDAMPYLSSAERELLISRTCDDCWKELYPD